MKYLLILSLWIMATAQTAVAQDTKAEDYIAQYKDLAIREMRRMGVPAAIKLAQGLLETESGSSALLKKSNNHFGIKCKSSWTGGGVSHDDDAPGECFRTYKDAEASYRDHSNFLRGSERYAFLFQLEPTDYKGWAYGLKKAGYATNPKYPQILIQFIEKYNLQQFSVEGAEGMTRFDANGLEDDKVIPDAQVIQEAEEKEASSGTISETRLNGKRCILAPKGTSLLSIATRYDLPLARLLSYNDLLTDGLTEEELPLYLESKSETGEMLFREVKEGERLYSISQLTGVQLAQLRIFNPTLGNGPIKPGTRVYLKGPNQPVQTPKNTVSTAAESNPSATTAIKKNVHIVQPKEGLYGIARKYGITVQQLKEWNGLSDDNLRIGQELIVSK